MQDKVCGLGNVVKIKSPFKPGVEEVPLGLKDYQEWAGFELGIVTEHVQKELDGSISRVALFLFDPDLSIIYLGNDGCPFPLDYSVDELQMYRCVGSRIFQLEPEFIDEGRRRYRDGREWRMVQESRLH